jgi:hypothetical protein
MSRNGGETWGIPICKIVGVFPLAAVDGAAQGFDFVAGGVAEVFGHFDAAAGDIADTVTGFADFVRGVTDAIFGFIGPIAERFARIFVAALNVAAQGFTGFGGEEKSDERARAEADEKEGDGGAGTAAI